MTNAIAASVLAAAVSLGAACAKETTKHVELEQQKAALFDRHCQNLKDAALAIAERLHASSSSRVLDVAYALTVGARDCLAEAVPSCVGQGADCPLRTLSELSTKLTNAPAKTAEQKAVSFDAHCRTAVIVARDAARLEGLDEPLNSSRAAQFGAFDFASCTGAPSNRASLACVLDGDLSCIVAAARRIDAQLTDRSK